MGATGVLILLGSILGGNAIMWVLILTWLRRRMRQTAAKVRSMLQGDERFVLEPTAGSYRGATDRFGRVKGTGIIALTDRRLICAKAVGSLVEVPVAEVVAVREDKWFLRSYNRYPHIILKLRDGVEVGFQVRDHSRWLETVRTRLGPAAA